jgi:hypothetical protein
LGKTTEIIERRNEKETCHPNGSRFGVLTEGRLYLFVAIDRTSKFAYTELHLDQTRDTACRFLRRLTSVVPYHIHTILTDNGIQFTNRQKDKWAFMHLFDRICHQHKIEHRLTKVNHPWTTGKSSE